MVSRGFMGNHVAATRSGRPHRAVRRCRPSGVCGSVFFSNKTENVFPRDEANVVFVYLPRRTDERIRIKDKYSWLPAVPGVAFVRSVGSNLMGYTIEEVRHGTRVASRFR